MYSRLFLFPIIWVIVLMTFFAVAQSALQPVVFTTKSPQVHALRLMNPGYAFRGNKNALEQLMKGL